jgi:hypothetical protein
MMNGWICEQQQGSFVHDYDLFTYNAEHYSVAATDYLPAPTEKWSTLDLGS